MRVILFIYSLATLACGIFVSGPIIPCALCWELRVFITGPPGKAPGQGNVGAVLLRQRDSIGNQPTESSRLRHSEEGLPTGHGVCFSNFTQGGTLEENFTGT